MSRRVKVALVTNIPAPYRVPVFERLARRSDCELHLVYCSGSEPDRDWQLPEGAYQQHYLKERFLSVRGRFIHVNPDVGAVLRRIGPDVVITTGYNPTHLLAFCFAWVRGIPHVAMTDGTVRSEATLSGVHRLLRRWVLGASRAFVGPSEGAFALFAQYGVPRNRVFRSHLCADNAAFERQPPVDKVHDLLFCGRFVPVKNPMFAMEVAHGVARQLGRRVSLAFMGSGELEAEMRAQAATLEDDVDVRFLGFAQQHELPARYGAARVFLFPTSWDPWGVVANEACAAGLPVVVTPEAGAAGELVRNGVNGVVLPLELDAWVAACATLLRDPARAAALGQQGRELVKQYSYEAAAQGLWDAVACAVKGSNQ